MAKTFTIKNYYEREFQIDDGVDGVSTGEPCPIRIRRFTVAQLQEFMRGWDRLQSPEAARFIYRKSDADEQQLREDNKTFIVSMLEVERRRLVEMTDEVRAQYDAAKRADDAHLQTFCSQQISEHIWLPKGVVLNVVSEDTDETVEVRDGKGLVAAFGGNLSMLAELTAMILEENTLTSEKKRQLRSRSASSTTSSTPSAAAEADGPKPATTVGSVEPEASAKSEPASVVPSPTPSGSTGT